MPIILNSGWSKLAVEIDNELVRARSKFPENLFLLPALVEEVGEAAKALMEHSRDEDVSNEDIRKELIQVATVAIRLTTEGDPDFKYTPRELGGQNKKSLETWRCRNCGNEYHWAQNICAACYPDRVDPSQRKIAQELAKEPLEERRKRNNWKQ